MYRKAAPNLSSILNRKIEIYQPVQQGDENELGQRDIAEKLIDTVYAAIVPQTGTMLHGRAAIRFLPASRINSLFVIVLTSRLICISDTEASGTTSFIFWIHTPIMSVWRFSRRGLFND